jgi:tRNA dimethylallyltransferase
MSLAKPADAVFLLGPTASGKSAAAMAIAEHFPVEIISVDSAQVYRGLNIGTAKPSQDERARVPHHLIDILDPTQAYSAARFAQDARRLIEQIGSRGRLPLLVGGTMLYVRAMVGGLHELPSADAQVRADIEHEAAAVGWPALHQKLAAVDPATAARLAPNDAQRIQRALEVFKVSGKTLSAWLTDPQALPKSAGSELPIVSLEPTERSWLHARIAQRFEDMIARGLIEEVRALRQRPDLNAELPALRSVGYRQVWAWLDQTGPQRTADLLDTGVAATRQLAKRQLTWLRAMPERTVIDCIGDDTVDRLVAAIGALWQP